MNSHTQGYRQLGGEVRFFLLCLRFIFNSRMNNNYRDDHKVLKWNLMSDETSEVSIAMYAFTYN